MAETVVEGRTSLIIPLFPGFQPAELDTLIRKQNLELVRETVIETREELAASLKFLRLLQKPEPAGIDEQIFQRNLILLRQGPESSEKQQALYELKLLDDVKKRQKPKEKKPVVFNLGRIVKEKEIARTEALDEITTKRLAMQNHYVERLKTRWGLDSQNPRVLKTLYRLNGGHRGLYEELEYLNASLPPMNEKCQFCIIVPAYNEDDKIETVVKDWIEQFSKDGRPVDPDLFEIIVFVNKPNSSSNFDSTAEKVEQLKTRQQYNKYNIHIVKKVFNFPESSETKRTTVGKKIVEVDGGVRMGLVYSVPADLAVLRNSERTDSSAKANIVIKTGGADALGRGPHYTDRVLDVFSLNPQIEQYNFKADYPSRMLQRFPLLHVVDRFREIFNLFYTHKKSKLGLGVYRMALYCEAGGFNPDDRIAEEVNLNSRMRKKIVTKLKETGLKRKDLIKRDRYFGALDDPRRTLAAMWEGTPLLYAYSRFDDRQRIADMSFKRLAEMPTPETMKLIPENLQHHFEQYVHYYLRLLYQYGHNEPQKDYPQTIGNFSSSCFVVKKYLERTLSFLGFKPNDYELLFDEAINNEESLEGAAKKIKIDPTSSSEELLREVIKRGCHLRVKSVGSILPLLESFKDFPRPEWSK